MWVRLGTNTEIDQLEGRLRSLMNSAAPEDIRDSIRDEARRLGFDAVGFAAAGASAEVSAGLDAWLADGVHGDMGWMAATAERRRDPKALWPEARSVVVLGMNYGPADDPLKLLAERTRGSIAAYAQGRDYHDVVKGRLKQLAQFIHHRFAAEVKVFVDTAPVMEKPLAAQGGIGWQGKHTNLVSRAFGSWLFLGEVFTTLALPPDEAEADHCGQCRRCLDICPTQAFPAPYRLDARRCISYLTIEHKGPIPRALRAASGNRIYGCDDCLAVCPWNKFAQRARESAFQPRAELTAPRLADLARLDDAGFRQVFSGSPIKRIGRDRFVRNVVIGLGNSGDAAQGDLIESLLDDPSPLVRGAAAWALGRLAPARFRHVRDIRLAEEIDETVRAEWLAEDAITSA